MLLLLLLLSFPLDCRKAISVAVWAANEKRTKESKKES